MVTVNPKPKKPKKPKPKPDGLTFSEAEQQVIKMLEAGWKFQPACEQAGITNPQQQDSLYAQFEKIHLV